MQRVFTLRRLGSALGDEFGKLSVGAPVGSQQHDVNLGGATRGDPEDAADDELDA